MTRDYITELDEPLRWVLFDFDFETGETRWEQTLHTTVPSFPTHQKSTFASETPVTDGERVYTYMADIGLFAVDFDGNLVWSVEFGWLPRREWGAASSPVLHDGRLYVVNDNDEQSYVAAFDAATGEELWRTRLIPRPGEPGDETWGGVPYEERIHVGSWMPASYDPELGLIYQGTSVTSPAPKFLLGGVENTHLYHNSTLALDVDTGEIRWHYQHLNDHWDLDHPFERILVDTAVAPDPSAVSWINPRIQPGEERRVVTGVPGKTGLVYTLDRETGEFLWATPTVTQNVISGIDGATGVVSTNSEVVFTQPGQQVFVCPTWNGGKDWEAGAYSPLTNTMYMPLRQTCARMMAATEFEDRPNEPNESRAAIYAIAYRHQIAPGTENVGTIWAISAETGATEWLYEQRAATMSLVATGGGLLFGGDTNGRFRAFSQETGEILWEINLGSPVSGFPISFGVDGRQYIAVATGSGGTASHFMGLTPELRPSSGNNLFVFALPARD